MSTTVESARGQLAPVDSSQLNQWLIQPINQAPVDTALSQLWLSQPRQRSHQPRFATVDVQVDATAVCAADSTDGQRRPIFRRPVIVKPGDPVADAVFTSLDLLSTYHQIRITPEDVAQTASGTHMGTFAFLVLPFGITNAPSSFQKAMDDIFRPISKHVIVYLDDILIAARSIEEMERVLEQVLTILEENQFYCKLSKCDFQRSSVSYLGHIVGGEGVKPDPGKVQVVQQWPTPTNLSQVRSFLGLATWFRKFIMAFSQKTAPLTELTKQSTPWRWGDTEQRAFDSVKEALTTAPTLALPDFNKPFELWCDASDLGVGAVLL